MLKMKNIIFWKIFYDIDDASIRELVQGQYVAFTDFAFMRWEYFCKSEQLQSIWTRSYGFF